MTLSEIALVALPLLARLKPNPLDAPVEVFIQLGAVAEGLEANGKKETANKVTVLMLAVAPVNDHSTRPEKLDVFATYLVQTLEAEMRTWLE